MKLNLDEKSRLLIPAEIRKKAGFAPGEPVAVEVVRLGEIRVTRLQDLVREARGMYSYLKSESEDITESFLNERKTEARQEDGENE